MYYLKVFDSSNTHKNTRPRIDQKLLERLKSAERTDGQTHLQKYALDHTVGGH